MNAQDIKQISTTNLLVLANKLAKHKDRRTPEEVNLALKSLPVYHCAPQGNIIEIIKSHEIKVKNQVVKGEYTNMSTDYFQGFENHISAGIGRPWVEYGPYSFAFGLEHISDDSLFFSEDPWLWSPHKFQKNTLRKEDFMAYARALLTKNLVRIGRWHVPIPFKVNLHWLAKRNFKHWECKVAGNLNILDAEEFFVWTLFDEFIYKFNLILGHPLIFSSLILALIAIIYQVYL
jgi:hypothetical protein